MHVNCESLGEFLMMSMLAPYLLVSRYAFNVFFKADRAFAVCGIVPLFAL